MLGNSIAELVDDRGMWKIPKYSRRVKDAGGFEPPRRTCVLLPTRLASQIERKSNKGN